MNLFRTLDEGQGFTNPVFGNVSKTVYVSFCQLFKKNTSASEIDISGKLVYTEIITGKEFVTINTQAFEAGVYIVRMRNELGQNNKRLVIK